MSGPLPAPTVVVGGSMRSPEFREALLEGTATEFRLLEPASIAACDPEVGCLLA